MRAPVVADDAHLREELHELVAHELHPRPTHLQEAMTDRLLHMAAEAGVNRYVLLVLVEHEGTANAMRYLYMRLADRMAAHPELQMSASVGTPASLSW